MGKCQTKRDERCITYAEYLIRYARMYKESFIIKNELMKLKRTFYARI